MIYFDNNNQQSNSTLRLVKILHSNIRSISLSLTICDNFVPSGESDGEEEEGELEMAPQPIYNSYGRQALGCMFGFVK